VVSILLFRVLVSPFAVTVFKIVIVLKGLASEVENGTRDHLE
jgi:hypothetical protein